LKDLDNTFYVYYHVSQASTAAARRAVLALFEDIRASTGIAGRLARRRDEPQTWMEIYERVADGDAFSRALQAGVTRHGLNMVLETGTTRKTEIFISNALEPESSPGGTACA
jgi:hypothetical protein